VMAMSDGSSASDAVDGQVIPRTEDKIDFYADGHSEEVEARADDCEHKVFRWTLHDAEQDIWRKECVFCPTVFEEVHQEEFPG